MSRVQWDDKGARVAAGEKHAMASLKSEVIQLKQALLSSGNALPQHNPKYDPKRNSKRKQSGGTCMHKGCGRKIVEYTASNRWKLCGTCLLKYQTEKCHYHLLMVPHGAVRMLS